MIGRSTFVILSLSLFVLVAILIVIVRVHRPRYIRESILIEKPVDRGLREGTKLYQAYNASIASFDGATIIACRLSSYNCKIARFDGTVNYYVFGNLLSHVDGDLIVDTKSLSKITLPINRDLLEKTAYAAEFKNTCPVYGVEDVRIIAWNGGLLAVGCLPLCWDSPNAYFSLAYGCWLTKQTSGVWTAIRECLLRPSDQPLTNRQKNWMPFVHPQGRLLFVTQILPLRVYELETPAFEYDRTVAPRTTRAYYQPPWDVEPDQIRGGTQLIHIEAWQCFLGMGHITSGHNRRYQHFSLRSALTTLRRPEDGSSDMPRLQR